MTYNSGKVFSDPAKTDNVIGVISYFADPYSSWQRGLNENFNGFILQYIPNKGPLSTVSDKEVARIENLLNNRPKK